MGLERWADGTCLSTAVVGAINAFPDDPTAALQTCRDVRAQCLADYRPTGYEQWCRPFGPAGNCTGAVGDFSDCLREQWERVEVWSDLSCEDFDSRLRR